MLIPSFLTSSRHSHCSSGKLKMRPKNYPRATISLPHLLPRHHLAQLTWRTTMRPPLSVIFCSLVDCHSIMVMGHLWAARRRTKRKVTLHALVAWAEVGLDSLAWSECPLWIVCRNPTIISSLAKSRISAAKQGFVPHHLFLLHFARCIVVVFSMHKSLTSPSWSCHPPSRRLQKILPSM